MYDIVVGRSKTDREKYGTKGAVLLAKQFITMGQTQTLSNKIYLDVTKAHVVFVCGKRGGGKSYTAGVIAEGLSDIEPEIAKNIAIVLLDTMGIYWTMKYPNKEDEPLLKEWGLSPKGLNVQIYTPTGVYAQYRQQGIPTDFPFSIKPSELIADDWRLTLGLQEHSEMAVILERVLNDMQDQGKEYDIDDMIGAIHKHSTSVGAQALINELINAKNWGLFSKDATPLTDLVKGGQITVLDVSCYVTQANGWNIKSLVVGILSRKVFIDRMVARKKEEYDAVHSAMHYFSEPDKDRDEDSLPLVWLVLDEAHEFLPVTGKTAATDALVTILREGRQPGVSLVLMTQQPGKIHTDVMTQSDTVIAHRITAKPDVDALGLLMQSYMRSGLVDQLDNLPRMQGAGIIFDDTNERMFPVRVRPRFTWHGGASPTAMPRKKDFNL